MPELPDCLYEPAGDRFVATALTRGPWDPGHQHAGPPAALLSREVDRVSGLAGGQTARIVFDILRPVPVAPLRVSARVLRPGRRVEQIEASLFDDGGQELMRATAWRMRRAEVELPPGVTVPEAPPPGPEGGDPGDFSFWHGDVAYYAGLDWSFIRGGFGAPGPCLVWTRLKVPLVAGEETSPLERLLVMADAASGVSAVLDWSEYLFINVDLGIHLERPPSGDWFAMDAATRIGDAGAGLCTSVLSDHRGRLGITTQSLLVDRR